MTHSQRGLGLAATITLLAGAVACAPAPTARPAGEAVVSKAAGAPPASAAAKAPAEPIIRPAPARPALPEGAELIPPEPGDEDFELEEEPKPAFKPLKEMPRALTAAETRRLTTTIAATGGAARFWSIAGDYSGELNSELGTFDTVSGRVVDPAPFAGYSNYTNFTGVVTYTPDDDEDPATPEQKFVLAVGVNTGATSNGQQVLDWYWTSGIEYYSRKRIAPWPERYKAKPFMSIRRWVRDTYDAVGGPIVDRFPGRVFPDIPGNVEMYPDDGISEPTTYRPNMENIFKNPNAYTVRNIDYRSNPYKIHDGRYFDGARIDPGLVGPTRTANTPETDDDVKVYNADEDGDFDLLKAAVEKKYPLKTIRDGTVYWLQRLGWRETMWYYGPQRSYLLRPNGAGIAWADNVWPNRWPKSGGLTQRRTRPVLRSTAPVFFEALETGALRMPAHLPRRDIVDYTFDGEGLDSKSEGPVYGSFTDLGGGRVRYKVPDDRMLVLNFFKRRIEVNGIELVPGSDAAYHGGSFLFGSGEEVEFSLTGTNEIAGYTIDPRLISGIGGEGSPVVVDPK